MVWNREQYIAHMTREYTGREFFTELFGPLIGLEAEWQAQGASAAELDLSAFGFSYVKYSGVPCFTGAYADCEEKVLEDTAQYRITQDAMGRKNKLCKQSATIPLPLDYPVKTFDDWLKIKHWYTFRESRVDKEALLHAKKLQAQGTLLIAGIPGGFDEPRQLLGEEELCVAFYEQPELVQDILDTIASTAQQVFERVCDVVTIDNLSIHEDMAGKSGPLAGPLQVREFIAPYYKKIIAPLKARGTKLFSQDSDGNMNSVIEPFLDAGINIMYPFEPGSGMDMVAARAQYGDRLAFKGGLDKYTLRMDKEAIRRELEYKICDATKGGGTIFALDHRIPNGVPIENYRYYVQTARALLDLPPIEQTPFVRMAF